MLSKKELLLKQQTSERFVEDFAVSETITPFIISFMNYYQGQSKQRYSESPRRFSSKCNELTIFGPRTSDTDRIESTSKIIFATAQKKGEKTKRRDTNRIAKVQPFFVRVASFTQPHFICGAFSILLPGRNLPQLRRAKPPNGEMARRRVD